ncbi:3,4-dihydroxy-2-butanone-4-phosphate synthase [Haladaptatus sp. DJG-WS-42]|uniref:3,4-dihydroxy-2-butanone-4-phosphate synthase n=1 Tax=Haladaptatus sp. DJG-WS-42 TaxID=3120516 RepID=UPI0030D4DF48
MAQTASDLDRVIAAFKAGGPVLIHDAADREGETDLIYPAANVAPADVARLRNDAGGLVCVALSDAVADDFGLPFLQDVLDHPIADGHDLGYDERSSFSLTVNHRDTFTGITDEDRALTIAELGRAAADTAAIDFAAEFRAPGHVHLLRAAPGLLAERMGHTELGIALADAAGVAPAVVVCEMLDDETGKALSPADARAYADRHGFPYIEGARLVSEL